MRVYISGPMTSKKNLNREAFMKAEKDLVAKGHVVVNPHRITEALGFFADEEQKKLLERSFTAFYNNETGYSARIAKHVMEVDIAAVKSCDAIYLLKGWEYSRGSKMELAEAINDGNLIYQQNKKGE